MKAIIGTDINKMIAHKGKDGKRGRYMKMSRHLERLYREENCRDCSVVVTRMDFAKILGKFTKVKIQYESNSSPKSQKTKEIPNSKARLKGNENGMVLDQKKANSLVNTKKKSDTSVSTPKRREVRNVLKEKNGPKDMPAKDKNFNYNKNRNYNVSKQYAIIFDDPKCNNNNIDVKSNFTLLDLLPLVDKSILPSEDWCIDIFPKNQEPTDDKVYDRIAAELEDLMYNEKPEVKHRKSTETKVDDFPSIMDILNDNSTHTAPSETTNQSNSIESKGNLESSDVEAMLLGKSDETPPMEVDNTDVNKLIEDVAQLSSTDIVKKDGNEFNVEDNPNSPSILDEALQKGIEEHLPCHEPTKEEVPNPTDTNELPPPINNVVDTSTINETEKSNAQDGLNVPPSVKLETVTHLIFKKMIDGVCRKSVTCPKNLKYSIELEDKTVEFLGAPKNISNLDDLQVLLQIVNETDLQSLYVLY